MEELLAEFFYLEKNASNCNGWRIISFCVTGIYMNSKLLLTYLYITFEYCNIYKFRQFFNIVDVSEGKIFR